MNSVRRNFEPSRSRRSPRSTGAGILLRRPLRRRGGDCADAAGADRDQRLSLDAGADSRAAAALQRHPHPSRVADQRLGHLGRAEPGGPAGPARWPLVQAARRRSPRATCLPSVPIRPSATRWARSAMRFNRMTRACRSRPGHCVTANAQLDAGARSPRRSFRASPPASCRTATTIC